MYDQELLQLIRREVLALAGMPELSARLAFIEPERLRAHVLCLLACGELSADGRFERGILTLHIRGLTTYGIRQLRAHDGSCRQ